MLDKNHVVKRPSTWVTEICEYNGFLKIRDVGPNDTTVYIDRVLEVVPWLPGDEGPDHHGIALAMARQGECSLY